MNYNKDERKLEAIKLINNFRSGLLDDNELSDLIFKLDKLLPDPNYWDYMVDYERELLPEEIVNKAFEFKPLIFS